MKKIKCANPKQFAWRIDHPIERVLAHKADYSDFWKRVYVIFYAIFDRKYYIKGKEMAKKTLASYLSMDDLSKHTEDNLIIDMIYSLHRFGASYDEYFIYKYRSLSFEGRNSYITEKRRFEYYPILNEMDNQKIFDDKYKTSKLFSKYYKRDVIGIYDENDKKVFFEFVEKHKRFIVKPNYLYCGRGIFVQEITESDNVEEIFQELLMKRPLVVEEMIEQVEEMKSYHPDSINTVRINTFKTKESVEIFAPFLRMGRNGGKTDNIDNDGIGAIIDKDTGIIITKGFDGKGNQYIRHPNTDKQIIGSQIPRWKECVETVKELALVMDGDRFCGWDMVLTPIGWAMIEENPDAHFTLGQYNLYRGIKKEFDELTLKCTGKKVPWFCE